MSTMDMTCKTSTNKPHCKPIVNVNITCLNTYSSKYIALMKINMLDYNEIQKTWLYTIY